MSTIATNNAVLIALRDTKKLLRQLLAAQTPPNPNASLTQSEFCKLEKIARSTFHKMSKEGRGPDLIYPVNGAPRITPEAHRRWREAREAEANTNRERD